MAIKNAFIYQYKIPLTPPLLLKGSKLDYREGFIVKLAFSDGSIGFGEAAPLINFSRESLYECKELLVKGLNQLMSQQPLDISASAALFAIECALNKLSFNYQCQHRQSSINNPQLPLLLGSPQDIISKYLALNRPSHIKLKVARSASVSGIKADTAIINKLCEINPNLQINLDANGAWSLAQAVEFANSIESSAIHYIEEPCQLLADSLSFAKQTGISIALDETLQQPSFVFSPNKHIKALVIKPTIIGSLTKTKVLIAQAKKSNINCYLSSSYESSLGISQLQYLASTLTPNQACGFDTLAPLALDIISDSNRGVAVIELEQLTLVEHISA